VLLVPDPLSDLNHHLVKTANSDPMGSFSISSIPPGEYRLYAWKEPLPVLDPLDPQELEPYKPYSLRVRVEEASQNSVELKIVPLP
jgi:hypothetical protein